MPVNREFFRPNRELFSPNRELTGIAPSTAEKRRLRTTHGDGCSPCGPLFMPGACPITDRRARTWSGRPGPRRVLRRAMKAWMAGTSPAKTIKVASGNRYATTLPSLRLRGNDG